MDKWMKVGFMIYYLALIVFIFSVITLVSASAHKYTDCREAGSQADICVAEIFQLGD